MLVLVALALGASRGELIALRRDHQFIRPAENWPFVLLYSDPSFMPKTARGRLPTEPYKLKALPQTVPPREDATVLCPVRALKAYLAATADTAFVNSRETLFLPLNCANSLSSYHLSKLFADALHFCYSRAENPCPLKLSRKVSKRVG